MKIISLLSLAALILQTAAQSELHAQVLSARRLTQRIAPQLPPAQSYAPQPGQPAMMVVQPPVDPAKLQAEKEEAVRKTEEFRKQRADEDALAKGSGTNTQEVACAPLTVECRKVEPNSRESLQFITLNLTNSCPAAINRITMHLLYCDSHGEVRKEWTTQRELDHPIDGKTSIELNQPAYFMPLMTRKVKIEVKEVRFSDGKLWMSSAN